MKSGRSLPRIVKGKSSPNRNRTYTFEYVFVVPNSHLEFSRVK